MTKEEFEKKIEAAKEIFKGLGAQEAAIILEYSLKEEAILAPVHLLARLCAQSGADKAVVSLKNGRCSLEFKAPKGGNLNITK